MYDLIIITTTHIPSYFQAHINRNLCSFHIPFELNEIILQRMKKYDDIITPFSKGTTAYWLDITCTSLSIYLCDGCMNQDCVINKDLFA